MKVHLLLPFLFGILNAFALTDKYGEESVESSDQAASLLKRSDQNCGLSPKLKNRIIRGKEAEKHAFPWMAAIRHKTTHMCGGSLIKPTYVLTAAHCLTWFGEKNSTKYWKIFPHLYVVLGDHYVFITEPQEQIFGIANYTHLNPDTNRSGIPLLNDVGVVKLNGTAITNQFVSLICLPNPPIAISPGDDLTVIGWGMFKFGVYGVKPEYTSKVLKVAPTKVIKNEDCVNFFGGKDENGNYVPFGLQAGEDIFCTIEEKDRGVASVGDSGSPLMYIDPITGKHVVVGLDCYGIGRIAEKGNTNVTYFLKDIEEMMAEMDRK